MKAKRIIALSLLAAGLGAALAVPARTLIQNKGSDTLVNVAQAWAEAYPAINPEVAVAVSGGGSGTGIAAMINGTVDIANSSRKMEEREMKAAEANGQHPVEHLVGFDALAVFINDKNPITALSIEQLRDIYGRGAKYTKWSDLGVKVPGCDSDEIIVASRQNNSGTYAYFKEAVLGEKGKYRTGTLDMHGSKEVVDLVEKTACAIGYSGLAYATDHVKMVCVAAQTGAPCVAPSVATASDHSYPIARPLYMYTNGEPRGEVKNYLDWILSDAGQCILMNKGYAPVRELKCE
jgi:phosphate transport system substrate-binding protein